jgi:acyl carrier protein
MYGPTETTIWSTMHPVTEAGGSVSIGRPIGNTQVYILDEGLQPVPAGVPGKFYIGGDGLARGYFERPALTAEKFIPDPFSSHPGARLYETGDLARYLPKGNIEFLGRIDHQVKLRGFRIELGEIETRLHRHPAVQETVVLVREDIPGDKRLVAYIIPEKEQSPAVNELRRFVKEKLPGYMVPSAFVFLHTFPLTLNGKINRRKLPAPGGLRPELETVYKTPQNELEGKIAKIWQETLKVDKVGIYDNFFDLGGHSLLMAKVHQQLRETLESNPSMVELFQYTTVHSLAKHLSHIQNEENVLQTSFERVDIRRERKDSMKRQRQRRRKNREV